MLWSMYRKGIFGEVGQAARDYRSHCDSHYTNELLKTLNVKNYKEKKPIKFYEYAKEICDFAGIKDQDTLDHEDLVRELERRQKEGFEK